MLAMEYDPEEARQAWIEYGIEQVAKNLLSMNLPIEYIMQATGWSEDKIRNLADDDGGK